jgi:hypothetical protein
VSVEIIDADDPLKGYFVHCPNCEEDFDCSSYPNYCIFCGGGDLEEDQ